MSLSITGGAVLKAQKVTLYGPEGCGKTLFASHFPNPLYIDIEGSSYHYDVRRTKRPITWTELLNQVRSVAAEKPCSTLVIDTIDWAERLCTSEVCAKNNWASIETPGYGAGFTHMFEEFGKLLDLLSDVTDAGINVVLNAHSSIRKFEQPDESSSYDRYQLKLIDTPKKSIANLVKEWSDSLLFINYKTVVEVVGEGQSAKGKARGGSKRTIYTTHHACWDAKNRWGLPDEITLDFANIEPFIPDLMAQQSAPVVDSPAQPTEAVAATQAVPQQLELPEFWNPAIPLMESEGIIFDDIREVSAQLGHFSKDTPADAFDPNYIPGFIVPNWNALVEKIKENREAQEAIPF